MGELQASFYSAAGEAKGKVDLPESLFGGEGSRRVLHEVVVAYQANQRRGTSSTLTRGNVTGGGHKPWKQKGTGNARAGSIRSPLWRKGGIIFGPHPRSYRVELDATKRLLALRTALIEKAKADQVGVLDSLSIKDGKTRGAGEMFKKAGFEGRWLLVLEKKEPTVLRALRNLCGLRLVDAAEVNALDVMRGGRIVFTKTSLDAVANRFPKG